MTSLWTQTTRCKVLNKFDPNVKKNMASEQYVVSKKKKDINERERKCILKSLRLNCVWCFLTCFSAFARADSSCANTISLSAVICTLSRKASSSSSMRSSFCCRESWRKKMFCFRLHAIRICTMQLTNLPMKLFIDKDFL